MKKIHYTLIATILTCFVFTIFNLQGAVAIVDLSMVVTGIIYLLISFSFFKNKENRFLNIACGLALIIAALLAILPLLLFFLNSITFVVNINYNDVLFNYYKSLLNALLGFMIFMIVSIIHFITENKKTKSTTEKRNYTVYIAITSIFILLVSFVILRRWGFHISYARQLIKITLLLNLFVLLPVILYRGFFKNRIFFSAFLLLILLFLNGVNRSYFLSWDFSGTKWLSYNKPVHEKSLQSIDTLKTISSLKKIGTNFYEITFTGNYNNILENNNKKCLEESIAQKPNCSLLTCFGDTLHYLFARNFDNPQGWMCKTLLCRTMPDNGYSSLALVRLADLGYDVATNIETLNYENKKALVNSVFYVPDGINEKGVVVAMASVDGRRLKEDTLKPYINCSYLIREILDHAKDVSEAIAIIKKYNIMNDVWSGSFDQHFLIADATGRSVIAEINNGAFQFISNTQRWQAITNSKSYNTSLAEQKTACPRFNKITTVITGLNGKINIDQCFNLLNEIGHQYTEWSAVYDMTQKEMNLVIDHDFSKKYKFSLNDTTSKNK